MKKKIKILFPIAWYYPIGGIETTVLDLTEVLKADFEIIWAINYKIKKSLVRIDGVKIIETASSISKMTKLIKEIEPDVVYFNNILPFDLMTMLYCKTSGVRIIFEAHQATISQSENPIYRFIYNSLFLSKIHIFPSVL